jgi:hypothetical protein
VFDPKAHEEKYELILDKAYEEVHLLTVKHKNTMEKLERDTAMI